MIRFTILQLSCITIISFSLFGCNSYRNDKDANEKKDPESPFNEELKKDIKNKFQKGTYLVLQLIVVRDEKENYVRVNPNLCWHYKS